MGSPRLISRGKVCQGTYLPGSKLEFEVTFVCTDDPAAGEARSMTADKPYDDDHVAGLFEKTDEIPTDSEEINIKASSSQLVGLCLADSTWINKIENFSDQLSGPLDPAHHQDDDTQNWWSWLSGKPDRPAQKAIWDNPESLPKAAIGSSHVNYQITLEANPEELLPRNTKMRLGELRKFRITARLPEELPPSYQGYSIRYTYYVFSCAMWSCGDSNYENVIKIPFTIWNPAASLRPMRPPFSRLKDNHCFDWRVKEVPPTGRSLCSQRAALPCFVDDVHYTQIPVISRSPLFDSGSPSFPECGTSRGSNSFCPSPSSILGEILGEGNIHRDNNLIEESPMEESPYHLNSYTNIEQLISLPNQQETETIVEHKGIPFLRLTTHGMHYTLGDSATGLLSVVDNSVCKCVRVAIKLEYEEQVPTTLFKSGTYVPSPRRQFPKFEEKYVIYDDVRNKSLHSHLYQQPTQTRTVR